MKKSIALLLCLCSTAAIAKHKYCEEQYVPTKQDFIYKKPETVRKLPFLSAYFGVGMGAGLVEKAKGTSEQLPVIGSTRLTHVFTGIKLGKHIGAEFGHYEAANKQRFDDAVVKAYLPLWSSPVSIHALGGTMLPFNSKRFVYGAGIDMDLVKGIGTSIEYTHRKNTLLPYANALTANLTYSL